MDHAVPEVVQTEEGILPASYEKLRNHWEHPEPSEVALKENNPRSV